MDKVASDAGQGRRMDVRRVALADLHPDPANARLHGPRNMDAIAASLRSFGQVEALVAQRSTGKVIGGNGRLEAMRALGWTHADVEMLDIDDTRATALGIALNRTAELAEWDAGVLDRLAGELRGADVDLAALGFADADIDRLLREAEDHAKQGRGGEEPEALSPPVRPTTRAGDVWRLGRHVLACGDSASTDVVDAAMRGEKAVLVFTDPPYNAAGKCRLEGQDLRRSRKALADSEWDKGFVFANVEVSLLRVMARDASCYVCSSHHVAPAIWEWMARWSSYYGYVVWSKSNPMPCLTKRHFAWNTELICYATRGRHVFNYPEHGHALSTWTMAKTQHNDLHPTMKPISVPAEAIARSSPRDGVVADLFAGAGSTLMACESMRRSARCVEIDPGYCDVIIDRFQNATGTTATLQQNIHGGRGAAPRR